MIYPVCSTDVADRPVLHPRAKFIQSIMMGGVGVVGLISKFTQEVVNTNDEEKR